MSQSSGTAFACPGCAATFTWKPQFAGRKMRCKCGAVFVPADPTAAGEVPDADPYDVDEGDAAAGHFATAAPPRPAPAVPSARAGAVPPAMAGLYPRRAARTDAEAGEGVDDVSRVKNLVVPLVLIALGLGLRVAQLLVANENRANKWGGAIETPDDWRKAVLLALCQMVIAGGVMVSGAVLAACVLNLNFGSVGRAALKLCATAVFATGVACWVAVFDQDRGSVAGLMVAMHLVVIIYWIAVAYFFRFEPHETLLAVAIIWLLNAAATCAIWRVG